MAKPSPLLGALVHSIPKNNQPGIYPEMFEALFDILPFDNQLALSKFFQCRLAIFSGVRWNWATCLCWPRQGEIPFNRNPLKIVSQNRWQIIHSIIMIALLFRSENGEIYLHREDDNPVWLMAEYACAAAVRPIHMQDYHEERSPACNSAINNQCTISLFSIINAPSFFFQ